MESNLLKKLFIFIFTVLNMFVISFIFNNSNASEDVNSDFPEFYGTTNITGLIGDDIDLSKSYYRIYAKDSIDGNITKNIKIKKNTVNSEIEGSYLIEYSVTNSRGKTANISVPVQIVSSGDRKIQRTLYVLPNVDYLNNSHFYRGNKQEVQNLGIFLPAGKSIKIRQVNKKCKSNVDVHFYNNDSLTEGTGTTVVYNALDGYDVRNMETKKVIKADSNEYVNISNIINVKKKKKELENKEENWEEWDLYNGKSYDSVPMIKTLYGIDEKPIVEIILNNDVKELDYYTYGDNEENFKNKWKASHNSFAILDGDRIQFLVPYNDLEDLAKSKKQISNKYRHDNFDSIDSILYYHDNIVETYDKWIGLSYDAEEWYNKNVKTKFFIKCNKHGVGGAAYAYWNYTYKTADTLDVFLHNEGDGWTALHEIGHGYQGILKEKELYLGEISNNFLAYYYQKTNLNGEDWLSEYNSNEIMTLMRNEEESFLIELDKPSTNESITGINKYKMKLFAYINLLNKINPQKTLEYTYKYCRYLVSANMVQGQTATDIIAKCFSEASGYNVIPYLEDWKLEVSDSIKKDIYSKDFPIVYYLRDLVSKDSEAGIIKNQLQLPWDYSVIENNDIKEYNYLGNLKIEFDDNQYNNIIGNNIILKSGQNVIKTQKIDNKIINIKNIPIGIYEIELDNPIYITNNESVIISKDNTSIKSINLTKRKLTEIIIEKQPEKTKYIEGENFDPNGMVIIAKYEDGYSREIKNYSIKKGENLSIVQKGIKIEYEEDGIVKTVIQMINVIEKLEINLKNVKLMEENGVIYIENILPNTTIEETENNIETNGTIEICKENTKITDKTQLIGTGMEIIIKFREQEARYITVVRGDLNGDGKMSIGDLLKLSRYAAKIDNNLTNEYLRASDLKQDGEYGKISDISKMSRILTKMDTF